MIWNEAPQVGFNEKRHQYTKDGLILPSVTQIMKPLTLSVYDGTPRQAMSDAADRGTKVHAAISDHVLYDILKYDDEMELYVRAFLDFENHFKPTWLASECRIHHKNLDYAGTIDLIGYVEPDNGNGVDVVDLKCTAQNHKILLDTQLGAYAEALKSHDVKIRNCYGLQLLKTGKYRFTKQDPVNGFMLFLHCRGLYNALRR